MENSNSARGFMAITAFILYLSNAVNEIVVVLASLMIADYLTGVLAAFINKTLSVEVARNGALKKVGFFFLPFLGFSLDFVIYIMTQKMGVNINTKGMFGISTCCWLIGTEGLSIADNLNDMGVPVPKFLINAYIKVKKIVEKSTEGEDVK